MFAAELRVATSAPMEAASCTAALPTPPLAPITRSRCPGLILKLSRMGCMPVSPVIGSAAASRRGTSFGAALSQDRRATTYSAAAPVVPAKPPKPPQTACPTSRSITPAPSHLAREIETGAFGELAPRHQLQLATPHNCINWIDAEGANLHQHRARPDGRNRDVPNGEFIRRAIPIILNRSHHGHAGSPNKHVGWCHDMSVEYVKTAFLQRSPITRLACPFLA